jgi:hypothetical protein
MHEYLEADKQNDLIKTPDKTKKKDHSYFDLIHF